MHFKFFRKCVSQGGKVRFADGPGGGAGGVKGQRS